MPEKTRPIAAEELLLRTCDSRESWALLSRSWAADPLLADEFSILAPKAERAETAPAEPETPKAKGKARTK